MSAPFPSITNLHKRDETTKRLNGVLAHPAYALLAEAEWIFTEKVDGCNCRVIWDGETVEVRGRTDAATLYPPLVKAIEDTFDPGAMAVKFGAMPVTLYGEGYGAKIQKGHVYRPDQGFALFDALIGGFWLERENLEDIAASLGCEIVPEIHRGVLADGVHIVRSGFFSHVARAHTGNATVEAEGLIGRPAVQLFDRKGERIQVKIKARDYRERVLEQAA